jgi:hypothetical protein
MGRARAMAPATAETGSAIAFGFRVLGVAG